MDVQKVLGAREVFWFSKKQFEVKPMWGDDSELANWKLYHVAHYTYTLHREVFLEYRRATRRTAVALAEAQAEVTRLRAALKAIVSNANAAFDLAKRYPSSQHAASRADAYSEACATARIARAALETTPAGEATNGNG